MALVVGRVLYKLLPYLIVIVVFLFWYGSFLRTPPPPHVEPPNTVDLPDPLYLLRELQLRQVIEECSARRDTVIRLDIKSQRVIVADQFNPADDCPVMDIALRKEERGVGMCTDVALYVVYAQARVIPLIPPELMQPYGRRCSQATARVFLESMYHDEWLSREPGVTYLMQVNHEHMWVNDMKHHSKINIFLAKTRVAHKLLQQYITSANLKSQVVYVGHSSSDPAVIFPPGASSDLVTDPRQLAAQGRMSNLPDYERFLHIKGKSGLKHTGQLLECWARNPTWPMLTVVGYLDYTNATKELLTKPNLHFKPTPSEKQEFEPIGFEELRQLGVSSGVQICASEREGFGHYINEARAASALLISTDHPPMNELVVHNVTGLLIKPSRTGSYPDIQVLGNYSHINGFLSVDDICAGVQQAILTPLEQRRMLGLAARQAYLADRRGFAKRVKALTLQLARLV